MKIFVKSVQGEGCAMNVNEQTTISDVKKHIETELKVPIVRQALILFGRPLSDDQTIASYPKIKDGTKINLIIKKPEAFEKVFAQFLLTYYTEVQAKLIVEEFMRDFRKTVRELSLDDVERIATAYLRGQGV